MSDKSTDKLDAAAKKVQKRLEIIEQTLTKLDKRQKGSGMVIAFQ